MDQVQKLSTDPLSDRALYVLSVPVFSDIPSFELDSRYFGVLLVSDSRDASGEDLLSVSQMLLDLGGVYFCCWGPGCEDVHDAIDYAELSNERPDDAVVMTTWHDKESLSETLWYFLNAAFPAKPFEAECRASIAIIVDSASWASECADALSKPRQFSEAV